VQEPNDNGRIRVLIADDHELFRRGLEQAFDGEPDIDVIAEAEDGLSATERTIALVPDVVLMDVRMPGITGVEAAHRIKGERPEVKIVMLSGSDDREDLFAAVRAGASGYLLKEVSVDDLADAVRAVHRGLGLLAPSMVASLMAEFITLSQQVDDNAPRTGAAKLTERELEVLRLVARGMSNKAIAGELVIAENTVKNHVRNILEKLHLRSRTEAAMYAVREKLVPAS
jgi:two-component system NarL family response regulator